MKRTSGLGSSDEPMEILSSDEEAEAPPVSLPTVSVTVPVTVPVTVNVTIEKPLNFLWTSTPIPQQSRSSSRQSSRSRSETPMSPGK